MTAARAPVVLRYLGELLIVASMLTAVPAVVALTLGEWMQAWPYLLVAAAMAGCGLMALRLPEPQQVHPHEAMIIVAMIFVLVPAAMTWPLSTAGIPMIDAFFEAMSGVTTTGLTTVATVEDRPGTFLFARAWMQWYGGLGVAVLAVALLFQPGVISRQLAMLEPPGAGLAGSTRALARRTLGVYLAITAVGLIAVWISLGAFFPALLYVLAAVSTGGFAPRQNDLAALGSFPAELLVLAFSVAGALPLLLFRTALGRGRRAGRLLRDTQVAGVLGACLLICILLTLILRLVDGLAWPDAMRQGSLLGISAQTTSGFAASPPAELSNAGQLALITAMFVGGGVGSTAGGLKVLRLLILLRVMQLGIRRLALPRHAIMDERLGQAPIRHEDVENASTILLLLLLVIGLSWMAFLLLDHPPLGSLFEVVSATGTVGLSAGVCGPDLATPLKVLLCIDMLAGRVEVLALVVLLRPRTWIGRRAST